MSRKHKHEKKMSKHVIVIGDSYDDYEDEFYNYYGYPSSYGGVDTTHNTSYNTKHKSDKTKKTESVIPKFKLCPVKSEKENM